ncbi:MAG: carboxymuconolactone decarboxylase family protein, partial [Gammaproteobacteria bacterium]
ALNECRFCVHAHWAAAWHAGATVVTIEDLIADVDASAVDEALKPLLKLARKITQEPARVQQADVDAVFAAGWDEKAWRDTVAIAARTNMVNRIVKGFEITKAGQKRRGRKAGSRRHGYLERMERLMTDGGKTSDQ